MLALAFKMLIGNKTSFIGIVFGLFLATLLISQQSAIFLGLISRSYRMITDIPSPTVWVMDPATESEDQLRGMPESNLDIVRGIPQVEWAVPINVAYIPLTTHSGVFHVAQIYGIDDATLIGAPQLIEGRIQDLRREGGVIIDLHSAKHILATPLADGRKIPLKIGDELEINNHKAVIVGISKITPGFYPQPIIYTTNGDFKRFNSYSINSISFIAAKTIPGSNIQEVCNQINSYPGFKALTKTQFQWKIVKAFLKTGILINFGLSVLLGFIIGLSIAGQVFYIMTLENLSHYALIKAIGGTHKMILHMIITQALIVGIIGFILGIGATILWGIAIKSTTLAFLFPWQLLLFTGAIVVIICTFTATLSIRKVLHADPKTLLGT